MYSRVWIFGIVGRGPPLSITPSSGLAKFRVLMHEGKCGAVIGYKIRVSV